MRVARRPAASATPTRSRRIPLVLAAQVHVGIGLAEHHGHGLGPGRAHPHHHRAEVGGDLCRLRRGVRAADHEPERSGRRLRPRRGCRGGHHQAARRQADRRRHRDAGFHQGDVDGPVGPPLLAELAGSVEGVDRPRRVGESRRALSSAPSSESTASAGRSRASASVSSDGGRGGHPGPAAPRGSAPRRAPAGPGGPGRPAGRATPRVRRRRCPRAWQVSGVQVPPCRPVRPMISSRRLPTVSAATPSNTTWPHLPPTWHLGHSEITATTSNGTPQFAPGPPKVSVVVEPRGPYPRGQGIAVGLAVPAGRGVSMPRSESGRWSAVADRSRSRPSRRWAPPPARSPPRRHLPAGASAAPPDAAPPATTSGWSVSTRRATRMQRPDPGQRGAVRLGDGHRARWLDPDRRLLELPDRPLRGRPRRPPARPPRRRPTSSRRPPSVSVPTPPRRRSASASTTVAGPSKGMSTRPREASTTSINNSLRQLGHQLGHHRRGEPGPLPVPLRVHGGAQRLRLHLESVGHSQQGPAGRGHPGPDPVRSDRLRRLHQPGSADISAPDLNLSAADVGAYLYGPGIPDGTPSPRSPRQPRRCSRRQRPPPPPTAPSSSG